MIEFEKIYPPGIELYRDMLQKQLGEHLTAAQVSVSRAPAGVARQIIETADREVDHIRRELMRIELFATVVMRMPLTEMDRLMPCRKFGK